MDSLRRFGRRYMGSNPIGPNISVISGYFGFFNGFK